MANIFDKTLSRRDFMAISASIVTAMSLGVISGTGVGQAAERNFPEGACAGGGQGKVLITYASKYGSTGGVADALGKELCGKNVGADVVLINNASEVASYQGVVVGSAIYRGRWMSEAADFVKRNREVLRQVPVAYFLVCISLARPGENNSAEVLSYLDPILKAVPEIKPVAIGTFAGALDYHKLPVLSKTIMQSRGAPEGDFRDWNAIRAWAREPVYSKLAG
ncbi:MAG: flavodoxin domain-containing protein [Pseudomonadota bacterium]